jgi:hypothetical protein
MGGKPFPIIERWRLRGRTTRRLRTAGRGTDRGRRDCARRERRHRRGIHDPVTLWGSVDTLAGLGARLLQLLGELLRSAVAHDPQSPSSDAEHECGGHGGYLEEAHACGGRSARVGQQNGDPDEAARDRKPWIMEESEQSADGHDRENFRQADIGVGVERRQHTNWQEP